MNQRGKYIVVEGCDGSGKTTAVQYLEKLITDLGHKTKVVNVLKDDPVSLQLRGIVTGRGNVIDHVAEACIYAAAVLNTYRNVIEPLVDDGVYVLSDRSHISALMYQGILGYEGSVGNNAALRVLNAAYQGLSYDFALFLYTLPQVGLSRVAARDGSLDRIESRGADYQNDVQNAYRAYQAAHWGVRSYDNFGPIDGLYAYLQDYARLIHTLE